MHKQIFNIEHTKYNCGGAADSKLAKTANTLDK